MSNNNLINTLSLWTEFNTVVRNNTQTCGYTSHQPLIIACQHCISLGCDECFFKIDCKIQDKTIESLDRHTGWKL